MESDAETCICELHPYKRARLGYWPSRSSFVREAVLEKFDKESQKLVQMRTMAEYDRSKETKEEKDAPRIPVKPE